MIIMLPIYAVQHDFGIGNLLINLTEKAICLCCARRETTLSIYHNTKHFAESSNARTFLQMKHFQIFMCLAVCIIDTAISKVMLPVIKKVAVLLRPLMY